MAARSVAAAGVHADGWAPIDARVSRFVAIPPRIERPAAAFMLMLVAAGSLILLIATTNVAGMLLARGASRRREMAIRLAIGADRWRLARQLLTESVLLAATAGAIGVLAALWASARLAAIRPSFAPQLAIDFPIDARVLGFAAAMSILSAVLFGLTPSLHTVRSDLVPGLKNAAPGVARRPGLRGALVAGQLALTLMLLVAAGLFVRTLRSALEVEDGFEAEGVLALELNLELNGYDDERGLIFYDRLLERVRSTPGIEAAALGRMIPQGAGWNTRVAVPGHEAPSGEAGFPVGFNAVSPGYFEAMRMPVVEGRGFRAEDAAASPTPIVVNRTFAQRFWPGASALGMTVRFALEDAVIIGVVPESERLGENARAYAYVPFGPKRYASAMWLYARTHGSPAQSVNALRGHIAELDPNVPPIMITTVEDVMATALLPQRTAAGLIGGFGLVGLLLAATGLFGMLSFSVAERTREIGVRMALGATRGEVVRMVLFEGLRPLSAGVALGLGAALALTRLLSGFLHGLSPTDPATFLAAPAVLLVVSLAAAWLPARRATRVEPVKALRAE
jgi:predicted permease